MRKIDLCMTVRSLSACSKTWRYAYALALGCAAPVLCEGVTLTTDRVTAVLSKDRKGSLVSFKSNADIEYAAFLGAHRLFALTVASQAEKPQERVALASQDAKTFNIEESMASNGDRLVTLTYGGFDKGVSRVICTAHMAKNESDIKWRISVQVLPGWILESVQYPIVMLTFPLGTSSDDDKVVLGSVKGGIIRPSTMQIGQTITLRQPGNLAAQFGCYYDDRGGFYTAALDPDGHPKEISLTRRPEGLEFSWYRTCFSQGEVHQDYDVVMSAFSGNRGAPADWRHAADIYKAWALTQRWCATSLEKRDDLPVWLRQGPAMVRFGREWLKNPARIESWLIEYWKKHFPETCPMITAYWGWEKHGIWVAPDYFPVYPSDEQFAKLVSGNRRLGCHAFVWPSGYHWTLTYNKNADGSFKWDDRARFDKLTASHAVINRDGKMYTRSPDWLNGGETACLCPGDPWTIRWLNEKVCLPLVQLGCEIIQIDQVVAGNFPECYSMQHGHVLGRQKWMTEVFEEQLRSMSATMRNVEPDFMVGIEEPNERFNHLVGLQDYRVCESSREWASVFNYIYHEFLPTFQSNPVQGDSVINAYCLVDGQMPHFIPSNRDLTDVVLVNGDFEDIATGSGALNGWTRIGGYKGIAWNGTAELDRHDKKSGESSLRLVNDQKDDIVQVAQNVMLDKESGFTVEGCYRISAWLKTEHMLKPNSINVSPYSAAMKPTGNGAKLRFPAEETEWRHVSESFSIPSGTYLLRIMIHMEGAANALVDRLRLEKVNEDGTFSELRYQGISEESRFMRRWVSLYHKEARPWLLFGTMLHPPQLLCKTINYRNRNIPAVLHNAFRAPDGREAIIMANATSQMQDATFFWHGDARSFRLPPGDVVLVEVK